MLISTNHAMRHVDSVNSKVVRWCIPLTLSIPLGFGR